MITIKLKLSNKQFAYVAEVLEGCLNDTMKESPEDTSLTREEQLDLWDKLSKEFGFNEERSSP